MLEGSVPVSNPKESHMNHWLPVRTFRSRSVLACVCLALVLSPSAARAEMMPHWKPDKLVPRSDLVILGTELSPTELRIDRILKGTWKEDRIEVPGLPKFRKEYGWGGEKTTPPLTGQCVVFLGFWDGRPYIVANGIHRIRTGGQLLGYAQWSIPGDYLLQQEPVYESLERLVQAVDAAKAQVPRLQEAALQAVTCARRFALCKRSHAAATSTS
jgi:hypothetical protein